MSTADYLVSLGVVFDEIVEVSGKVDSNRLSLGALRDLDSVIYDYRSATACDNFRIDLPNIVNLCRRDDSWALYNLDGKTFGVRYADFVKSISRGLRLPGDLVSKLSESARRLKGVSIGGFRYDLTVGSDWCPGDFGESSGSCWWTDFDAGRVAASDSGDLCALRFYDSRGDGIGRCWVWYVGDALVCFNAYHRDGLPLESMARVLVSCLGDGWDSCKARIYSDALYINGGDGVAVSRDVSNIIGRYDIEVKGLCWCDCCDSWVNEVYQVANGDSVCEDCLYDYYFSCAECGEYFRGYDALYHDGDSYCDDCYNDLFAVCDSCGGVVYRDDLVGGICPACVSLAESESAAS